MQKRYRYSIGIGVVVVVFFMGLWFSVPIHTSPPAEHPTAAENPWQQFQSPTSGIGTEEDPYARQRYRWMRLRNPTTGRIPPNIRENELSFAKQLPKTYGKVSAWNQRGPVNIGGRTRALAYDVSDPSGETILAAGVSGGMWRTTNGGDTWTRTFEPGQRPNVTTVVQDTSGGKTDVWYAGTGELIGNSASGETRSAFYKGDGIYKSTNGGTDWTQLSSTTSDPSQFETPFDFVHRVRIDPSNDSQDEVYAATYDKIFRSTDGGESWTAVREGDVAGLDNAATQTDVAVTSTGTVYATLSSDGDNCGIFRSTDGLAWTKITPSGWPGGTSCQNDYFRTVLDVNPSNESEVWFLAYAPGYGTPSESGDPIDHVLWTYDASSDTWSNYNDYLPPRGTFGRFATQRGYDILIEVHPSDPGTIYAGGVNLWQIDVTGSADEAETWIGGYQPETSLFYQSPAGDPQHPDQHTLTFHPTNPNVSLTGSDGGVHRTDDNRASDDTEVSYISLNNGYFTTQFYHVCMNSDAGDPTVMGGMQDNGTWFTQSVDPTVDWSRQRSGDGAHCEIVNAQRPDTTVVLRYASSQNGFVAQYTEEGQSPQAAYPQGATGQLFIHPFEIDRADPSVMYYPAGDTLYRHTNVEDEPSNQDLWTSFSLGAPSGHLITTLETSFRNDEHVLYVGAADGDGDNTLESPRLYRLDDAATRNVPTDVTSSSFPDGAFPSDIAVNPGNSDHVLVSFSNYGVSSLFYSTDGGETWTDVEGNLGTSTNGPSVRSVSILPQPAKDQTTYYAATSVGLYSTTSLGNSTTWSQESPGGLGNVVVNDVESRPSDGQVLAGTHANGVYSSDVAVPVRVANFEASKLEDTRGVTLTWQTPNAVSPDLEVQHLYRNSPYDSVDVPEQTDFRTYRYQVARPAHLQRSPTRRNTASNARIGSVHICPRG